MYSERSSKMLLVEDDPVVRANFAEAFTHEGYEVTAVHDRRTAEEVCASGLPDIALVDVSLPGEPEGGLALAEALRRRSRELGIVCISAFTEERKKERAMRVGADDYLSKNASLDYVLLRVRALHNRLAELQGASVPDDQLVLELNEETREVQYKNRSVRLTPFQFKLLQILLNHSPHIVSAKEIVAELDAKMSQATTIYHIHTLRRGLEPLALGFQPIETRRGEGYRWAGRPARYLT